MFIMDFDRHEDQWRWNTKDTGKGKLYYPLPRDCDQGVFLLMKGFFTKKPIAKAMEVAQITGLQGISKGYHYV